MKKTRMYSSILCVVILLTLLPMTARAADEIIEVSTVAELRAALENNSGAHVRLKNDIIFTKENAANKDAGVILVGGSHIIDLNGYTIKYHYMTGGEFSDTGVPIGMWGAPVNDTIMLVINGPGSVIGGTYGVESWCRRGILIVNGCTIQGIMGHGIAGGGLIYVNGAIVTGNFGSIQYEQGVVVLNDAEVKKVNHKPFNNENGHESGYGVIRDGVLTGYAVLNGIILDVTDLTISEGASIKVTNGGGLIVRNSFVNKGTFTYEAGLKSIGGEATIKRNPSGFYSSVDIIFDMNFSSLDIQDDAHVWIGNGATVTITGAFSTGSSGSVIVENGALRLLGSIDHKGRSEGVPELAALEERRESPEHN